MGNLLEEEEAGDKDFYSQAFWDDENEDGEYDVDADAEDGADSFDSDFGDSTDSSEEDDGEETSKRREPAPAARKKSVYVDPKLKAARPAASSSAQSSQRKRARSEAEVLSLQQQAPTRGSMRASTKDATALAVEKRRVSAEMSAVRAARHAELAKSKGVELRRLTQEDILAEAKQTEMLNRASLEMMLRVEEEKRKTVVRDRHHMGPRMKIKSTRDGNRVENTITFIECAIPPLINASAPQPHVADRCAVTGQPAKYLDPATHCPYATLEAFRMLRGKTGRRHSFSPATPLGASSSADGALPLGAAEIGHA